MSVSLIEKTLAWLTAFAVVFSLYAHTFFGLQSSQVTPIIAMAIAAGLSLISLCFLPRATFSIPHGVVRKLAAFLFVGAWLWFAIFGLLAFVGRAPTPNDWGLYFLEVGVPVLLLFSHARLDLLRAIGWICVGFAVLDAVVNLADVSGFHILGSQGGRYTAFGRVDRYPGLTGNSHAGGLVALVAVCMIAPRMRQPQRWVGWLAAALLLGLIGASLVLIDARRYTGEAVMAAVFLVVPLWRVIPLQLIGPGVAAWGLYFTFNRFDADNSQRGDLMADAWREASHNIWSGGGLFYRAPPDGSDFSSLWAAGVTESGVLDLATAFGWIATVAFLVAVFLALSAQRTRLAWPAALLAVMAGELAYGDPLNGFLGATLFYACLIFTLCDEGLTGAAHAPDRSRRDLAFVPAAWHAGGGGGT